MMMDASNRDALLRALPYARRYARALAGSQQGGDGLVADALRTGLDPLPPRLALYRAISLACPELNGSLTLMQRQVLLLVTLEDLAPSEAALVLDLAEDEVATEIEAAREAIRRTAATDVLLIEDEPIIAMDLQSLIEEAGHRVVGVAESETAAVEMAERTRPGLIIADVNLGPGGDGITAVQRILASHRTPVIFVTAYPERLLTAERIEPAFVIAKPFEPTALAIATFQAVSGGVRLT